MTSIIKINAKNPFTHNGEIIKCHKNTEIYTEYFKFGVRTDGSVYANAFIKQFEKMCEILELLDNVNFIHIERFYKFCNDEISFTLITLKNDGGKVEFFGHIYNVNDDTNECDLIDVKIFNEID